MALDFLNIRACRKKGGGWTVNTSFVLYNEDGPVKDIMVKGGDFYAIYNGDKNTWSTKEHDAERLIDAEIRKVYKEFVKSHPLDVVDVGYIRDSDSLIIDKWHKYVTQQIKDNYVQLDSNISFQNSELTRDDYASKRVPYSIPDTASKEDYKNWDKLIGTLYDYDERLKLEWAIGSIVSGDSTWIQKFVVLYGPAGCGKSTILNVIEGLFEGYCCSFDSQALTNANAQFSLEPFKNNPLVAIQHDGDLSRITENTRLNSLVSHEKMNINEKHKSLYESRFRAMLFVGTNKPVRITDGKSGLLRRLIDVSPSGNKIPSSEYNKIIRNIKFEYGAIARHCLDVYNANKDIFDDYIPVKMIDATNDTFNFMVENFKQFYDDDGVSLTRAWTMYKTYCDEANVPYPLPKRDFKEELKSYFRSFEDRYDGTRNYYHGFLTDKFESHKKEAKAHIPDTWIQLTKSESKFDDYCDACLAQYATEDESRPVHKWENCKTHLADLDTSKLHFVKLPETHIIIDFDIKDENGNKSLEKNIQKASKFPPTYCEVSKSGGGLHLHYIYDGDVSKLSSMYDKDIEIKVFSGNSSLRRKLSLCNDLDVAHISSGLPMKKEKKMVDFEDVKDEQHLRNIIKKCLRKEVHDATAPNVSMIYKALRDAYMSGMKYDVSDMFQRCFEFASASTNQASFCMKMISDAPFTSEEPSTYVEQPETDPICFFDVEVFPNLFVVCYKVLGTEKVLSMINPKPDEIEKLLRFRLVGFNNRRYDNHMIYARYVGASVKELYALSKQIIDCGTGLINNAYNLSYTDIYDYMATKMSLKKLEIKMGIRHDELSFPWDEPVPKEHWGRVAEYCCHDVEATEAAWNYTQADFTGRKILADLAGMSVNDTTNTLTTKFIFGDCKNPQQEFIYRDLSKPVKREDYDEESIEFLTEVFPEMMAEPHGDAKSMLPYFPNYEFKLGKSYYRGELVGEGGYAEGFPGYYVNCALLDVMSMHPHSAMAEVVFGPRFTRAFYQIVYGRVNIKHKAWDEIAHFLDGKLVPYIEACKEGKMSASDLAYALKIAINSVYGLTSAHFENSFKDPRNLDNIVAKRGALFMMELKHVLRDMGYPVAHIKTDSIKIPNADPEIIRFVMDFGKRYGYTFEHEATYEKMILVNDAVYIAKYATPEACEAMYGYVPGDNADHADTHRWTATGTQFQIPYTFKTLFSREELEVDDYFKTFSVQRGEIYLDYDESLDIAKRDELEREKKKIDNKLKKIKKDEAEGIYKVSMEEIEELKSESTRLGEEIMKIHNLQFVGRVGEFVPVKAGANGATMYRVHEGKLAATAGSTGYRWLESATLVKNHREDDIDVSYWASLADEAKDAVSKYHDYEYFATEDIPPFDLERCPEKCVNCPYFRDYENGLVDCRLVAPEAEKEKADWCLEVTAKAMDKETIPF
jgi:hypothetical protein